MIKLVEYVSISLSVSMYSRKMLLFYLCRRRDSLFRVKKVRRQSRIYGCLCRRAVKSLFLQCPIKTGDPICLFESRKSVSGRHPS